MKKGSLRLSEALLLKQGRGVLFIGDEGGIEMELREATGFRRDMTTII